MEPCHRITIEHYDGSTIEAYKIFYGDRYRLQLKCKKNRWSWKFSCDQDNMLYPSREHALIACTGFLFRRIMQLSVALQIKNDARERKVSIQDDKMPYEKMLPRKFKCVDSIDFPYSSSGFIDILVSDGKFYTFYSDSTFGGPFPSKDSAFKSIIKLYSDRIDEMMLSCLRIRNIVNSPLFNSE